MRIKVIITNALNTFQVHFNDLNSKMLMELLNNDFFLFNIIDWN